MTWKPRSDWTNSGNGARWVRIRSKWEAQLKGPLVSNQRRQKDFRSHWQSIKRGIFLEIYEKVGGVCKFRINAHEMRFQHFPVLHHGMVIHFTQNWNSITPLFACFCVSFSHFHFFAASRAVAPCHSVAVLAPNCLTIWIWGFSLQTRLCFLFCAHIAPNQSLNRERKKELQGSCRQEREFFASSQGSLEILPRIDSRFLFSGIGSRTLLLDARKWWRLHHRRRSRSRARRLLLPRVMEQNANRKHLT